MRKYYFIIFLCCTLSTHSQIYDSIFTNDKYKVTEFSNNRPETVIIENESSDTIWISYMETQNLSNNKIIAIDEDLNIITSIPFNHPPSITNFMNYKINDKFYGLYYTHYHPYNWDTLQFKCFDKNGNNLIDKPLWFNNAEDSLWINNGFQVIKLSNNNFCLIANANPPNIYNYVGSSAVKIIIFDTLGNIINTKAHSLISQCNEMKMCELGDKIVIDKVPLVTQTQALTGGFSNYGISIINRETLELEDSIIRGPVFDSNQSKAVFFTHYRLEGINDSIFAGIMAPAGRIKLHLFNINTKEITNKLEYIVEGGSSNYPAPPDCFEAEIDGDFYDPSKRYSFLNKDSIYVCYFVSNKGGNYLELLNFSLSGELNYLYRFDFKSTPFTHIAGIKATQDGGVIISILGVQASILDPVYWLIKFNPKGLVNLTNVETGERESIRVYPNPAKDYIEVDIEAERFSSSEIELFDMQGRMVKRAKLAGRQGNRIDVSSLPPGAYTYSVTLNEKAFSGKIIIGN